jgi:uncharacterized protein YegJ (DUF2314 family)
MPIKWLICAVIIATVVAGVWLRRARRKRKGDPPASIVVFLQRPKPLNVQILAQVLSEVTGRNVRAIALDDNPNDNNRPAGDMVAGASPHFIAYASGTAFAIHNLSSPYVEDQAHASESIPELRLRKAIREHTAWLSMDIVHAQAATPEAYRVAARVLAKLIDADCLALYHPPSNRFAPCKPDETKAKLNSDDPIKAVFRELTEVPVIPIDDDPRLKSAEAEARGRFTEFAAAFQKRDGDRFAVKASITANGNTEHIWVEVDRISMGRIEGRLGNDPVDLGDLEIGSEVEIETGEVEDWVFMRNGGPVGLFTVPVIQRIEQER